MMQWVVSFPSRRVQMREQVSGKLSTRNGIMTASIKLALNSAVMHVENNNDNDNDSCYYARSRKP